MQSIKCLLAATIKKHHPENNVLLFIIRLHVFAFYGHIIYYVCSLETVSWFLKKI